MKLGKMYAGISAIWVGFVKKSLTWLRRMKNIELCMFLEKAALREDKTQRKKTPLNCIKFIIVIQYLYPGTENKVVAIRFVVTCHPNFCF